jgi:hypothetical protein
MDKQDIFSGVEQMPLMDMYEVARWWDLAINKRRKSLMESVSVEKNKNGATILSHPDNGSYIVKPWAFRGRLRMWKMIPGSRGLKQGPMVVKEHTGDLDSLKVQIALGHYKEVNA